MKRLTYLERLILVCVILLPLVSLSQVTIDSENYETGWGIWNSGGSRSQRLAASPPDATYAIRLGGNGGVASSMYTNNIDLSAYGVVEVLFDYQAAGMDGGDTFTIEFSSNGGSTWTQVEDYVRNKDFYNTFKYSVSINLNSLLWTFNTTNQFRIINRANGSSDYIYIDNVVIQGYNTHEIEVRGAGIEIVNNDMTPAPEDRTDYGSSNINEPMSKTFSIYNIGANTLNISGITLSNTTDFSIVGSYNATVSSGAFTTLTIQFNALSLGLATTTVTIVNDDADEPNYQYMIQAIADQSFFDSDGDGIFDNDDIDDDNDGIADVDEESYCENSSISVETNYKFLNETFGFGDRTTINTTYDAITTYCYESGTSGTNSPECAFVSNINLNDGEYVVYHRAGDGDGTNDTPNSEVASWADAYWYTGEDHTPGDTQGRMAMFNASYDPGIFYTANISGALPGIPITYSFWVLNLDRTDAPNIGSRLRPNILVEFFDLSDNLLASITTGDIPPTTAGNTAGDWYNFTADLVLPVSEFNVIFTNNETGGLGNDLAIDDIVISQTLCDTDGDTVADVFDLDSDNDGIPDVVEAGFGSYSAGTARIDATWVDTNSNGMHDAVEGLSPLDSDGDGTPNFIDLDSDNDAIFDVDESGAGNTADTNFQNGDGDIDGDGVGDGPDTDTVRETDYESDGISEYFTDGILDVYDYFNGGSFNTAYGNTNQGLGFVSYVIDTDGDTIPDYIDLDSDNDGIYDIAGTLYSSLDANNNGAIDDTVDTEGDGLLDLFDTDDAAFGSPRDLDTKLTLFFDGRNDYVEDASLTSGLSEVTIMGWIKIDPTSAATTQRIFGQDNIFIVLKSNKRVRVVANDGSSYQAEYTTALPTGQWVHVGATYDSSKGLNLYVNGEAVASNTSPSGNLTTDTSNFTIGRRTGASSNYFKGNIDEVRIFDVELSETDFQKMVYQEIEDNTEVRGTIVPRDIAGVPFTNILRYYRLDGYKGDITDDLTTPAVDTGTGAKLYNIKRIEYQTAPMPFVTQSGGSLETAVNIPADGVNGNDAVTYDWSIVRVEHNNVTYNGDHGHLALFVNELDSGSNPIEYTVENDSELNVSWYLELDGKIDLEGESQLVQGDDSILDATSKGQIERDQQGTADVHTYNYWSSPVGQMNATSNNNSYTLPTVMRDGTQNINWITSGYDGSNTSPIGIADYWIWKFANQPDDDYSAWQHVRSTGTMLAGEGFTMKGPGTGGISDDQNYVFNGKPNNGDINLTINAGNDYLVGNPYPSAIDAHQFILDNAPIIEGTGVTTGTIYFWEHWGGGSHILAEYQGGYATYNLAGGVPAASQGTNDPDVGTGGVPQKTPGRYIPVSQGFFVVGEQTGNINFNNGQRIFRKESASSVFMEADNTWESPAQVGRSSENEDNEETADDRMKIRLGFHSVNEIRRQLLITVDSIASTGVDYGFDAKIYEDQMDDMYWMLEDEKYIIQGIDNIDAETVLPIGVHVQDAGSNEIMIDELLNFDADQEIYLHDKTDDTYHDLRAGSFTINLDAGAYLDRFEIVFSLPEDTLSTTDEVITDFNIFYANAEKTLVIQNPTLKNIQNLTFYDITGRRIFTTNDVPSSIRIEYEISYVSTGAYVVKINSESGSFSKKLVVE